MKKLLLVVLLMASVLFVTGCSTMPRLFYRQIPTEELMVKWHKSTMNCSVHHDEAGNRLILPSVTNEIVVANCSDYTLVIEGNGIMLDPGLKRNGNWNFYGEVYSRTSMSLVIKVVDPKDNRVVEVFSKSISLETRGKVLYSFLIEEDDGRIKCRDMYDRNVSYESYGGGSRVTVSNNSHSWRIFGNHGGHHDNNRHRR